MRKNGRRAVLGLAVAVLLAIAVPPLFNVNRYRADVTDAIGRAMGRRVSVDSVRLRLFPQPGFLLSNLVIADDPAFSAEPLLRAGDVTASLRLTSLWRGRLEMARLSLSYPSLNLVRRRDGHWNLESLLARTASAPAAPTGNTKPEARPRFPYIEAEGGRINLKLGQEKKAYALSEADFAFWLASEKQWKVRLAARPVRTDDNLSDTGTVKLSGSFGAAAQLADTPLALDLTLERAQLGQFTKLVYGRDRGWRGALSGRVLLRGTPASLGVTADALLDDFRRFDTYSGNELRLATHCRAWISSTIQELREASCRSSAGTGVITATARARWSAASPDYRLQIRVEEVPATRVLAVARRLRNGLPQELAALGSLNATLELHRGPDGAPLWTGTGSLSDVLLRSPGLAADLSVGDIHFQLVGPGTEYWQRSRRLLAGASQLPDQMALSVAPFTVALGGASAATVQAWISRRGYKLLLQGDAEAERSLQIARAFGLSTTTADLEGFARVSFELAGQWDGAPAIIGSAHLRSITARVDGLRAPLLVPSGTLAVSPNLISLQSQKFSFAGLPLSFSGWVRRPQRCARRGSPANDAADTSPPVCPLEFQLAADRITSDDLNRLLNPRVGRRSWYQLLSSATKRSAPLANVSAAGRIAAGKLVLKSVVASHVEAELEVNGSRMLFRNLRAELLDGRYRGDLRADLGGPEPSYQWHGQLEQVSMSDVARLLQLQAELPAGSTAVPDIRRVVAAPAGFAREVAQEDWSGGRTNISTSGNASGWTSSELLQSAAGSLTIDWRQGIVARLALDGAGGPLRIHRFAGELQLRNGTLSISRATLDAGDATYQVSGTASLAGELGIKLVRVAGEHPPVVSAAERSRASAYNITGPLAKPRVISIQTTEAALTSSNGNPRERLTHAPGQHLPATAKP